MTWRHLFRIFGVLIFFYICTQTDWRTVIFTLKKLDIISMSYYVVSFIVLVLLRSARLQKALCDVGQKVSLKDSAVAILEPALLGMLTPGRIGEFSRVAYLRTHDVSVSTAASVVMIERLLDVGVLLVFGLAGVAYIFRPSAGYLEFSMFVAGGLGFIFLIIHYFSALWGYAQKFLMAIAPGYLVRFIKPWSIDFMVVMNLSAKKMLAISVACFCMSLLQIYFLACAFGIVADYLIVGVAYTVSTLVTVLPISIGGLGTREATYIFIMGHQGIQKEDALLFSLLDGFVFGILLPVLLLLPIRVIGELTKTNKAHETDKSPPCQY